MTISGGNVDIESCEFILNKALNGNGGALLLQFVADFLDFDNINIKVKDTEFNSNSAIHGGAIGMELLLDDTNDMIYTSDWKNNTLVNLQNIDAINNYATNCGGAIGIIDGSIWMSDSQITQNEAKSCGGGIYLQNGWFQDESVKY